MTARPFVDTNVWFYALSASDEAKRLAANHLLDSLDRPIINGQVIRELCVNLLKKSSYNEPAIQELTPACIGTAMLPRKPSTYFCAHQNCASYTHSAIGTV